MLTTRSLFCLQIGASDKCLGAVLFQVQDDGTSRVRAYASRTLSKSDKNYDSHKLKFLALKMGDYRQIS